ncbi:DinB family protein [Plantactinospora siamensis]|uniref:DinB family protein n=1 Tax=Plantactinospora siamensis TaxID=555372 RepID=A0ABV6NUF7_9ACTN
MSGQREVGYAGMWAPPEEDPRLATAAAPEGELATIREYLSHYRLTLGMKCEGLSAEQLATRSVPPSTMSLLGLIRHMAGVEHHWFHRTLQNNLDTPRLYWSAQERDLDFDGAVADPDVVRDAFEAWRAQIAAADAWLDSPVDLSAVTVLDDGERVGVRDILIHMIEEYARHCGHADLLRECIDGRTGQ